MKVYTFEEIEDEFFGKKGTPERDAYEDEKQMIIVGSALKKARMSKNLTQEELGKMVGVQKAQISKIENGKDMKLSSLVRYLHALGLSTQLHINTVGNFALC